MEKMLPNMDGQLIKELDENNDKLLNEISELKKKIKDLS